MVGWYIEIPRSLRDEFDKLYPGRRHKKILTITAIQRAIRLHPKSLHNLYKEAPSDLASGKEHDQGSSTNASGSEKDGTFD